MFFTRNGYLLTHLHYFSRISEPIVVSQLYYNVIVFVFYNGIVLHITVVLSQLQNLKLYILN